MPLKLISTSTRTILLDYVPQNIELALVGLFEAGCLKV